MPAIDMTKRYYCSGGYCYNTVNRPWWIALIVAIPLVAFLLMLCLRRRNFTRRKQGQSYIPYTGWTAYGQQNAPPYQQQQPYNAYVPPQGPPPPGQGYYGTENKPMDQELPTYQQSAGAAQYNRPGNPPPNWETPQAPQQAYRS